MTTQAQPPPAQEIHGRGLLVIYLALMLAILLAALDQTIVSTALPTIVGDLGGLSRLSWVVTAYILASTVATPLWGKLGDQYGRKRLFQGAIVIFLVGSALCGLAQDINMLIAFRALQGLGGGGLMVLAQAIVGDVVPPRDRGRYQGAFGAVFGVASVAGPLLGGFFVDNLGWRWVFYINLPIGVVALAVIAVALPATSTRSHHTIDYVGTVLLGGAATCVVLLTSWGGTTFAVGIGRDHRPRDRRRRADGRLVVVGAPRAGAGAGRRGCSGIRCSGSARPSGSRPGSRCSARSRSCRSTCRWCAASRPRSPASTCCPWSSAC